MSANVPMPESRFPEPPPAEALGDGVVELRLLRVPGPDTAALAA